MALRTFADTDGRVWEVWDVMPHSLANAERRAIDRRADEGAQSAFDRRQADRRAALSPGMANGWLAFRCGEERRRLAPIPNDWASAAEPQLQAFCRDARVVGIVPIHFTARTAEPDPT